MGKLILSDEIYHGLVYEGRARSVLEFTDNCIVFNGFSKLFAMTGWRLGYLIAPAYMIRPIQKMVQNFFISANSVAQAAGYTALTDQSVAEEVAKMLQTVQSAQTVYGCPAAGDRVRDNGRADRSFLCLCKCAQVY